MAVKNMNKTNAAQNMSILWVKLKKNVVEM